MIHSQYLSALNVKRPTVDSDAIVPSSFLMNTFRLKCPTACVYRIVSPDVVYES